MEPKRHNPDSEIAAFVKAARRRLGISQETMGALYDCTKGNVSGWENGRHEPPFHILKDLSIRSGVPLSDQISDKPNVSTVTLSQFPVPLISWVRAGDLTEVVDNHAPGEADSWVTPEFTKPSRHAFALRVEGESMSGGNNGVNFPDGCIIIVDPERSPRSGDYVVAKDVVTQKATFKKLTTDGASWYLKPLNPAYPTKEIDDPSMRVIGVVIEWQMGGKL